MNLLDLVILLPLMYFSYKGFVNGLIKEVLSIIGIILAVFLTFEYMDSLNAIIGPYFGGNESYIPFVSGIILFVGTIAVVQLVAHLSKKMLEAINLNILNRLSGMAFGFLKSGIVISAILLMLAGFNQPSEKARNESVTYSTIVYLAPLAYDAVATVYPGAENFSETIQNTLDEYNPIQNFPTLDQ
ncbi:CvpA family protein [Aliifodinibius sp. S!AR15-10]|uniref:CvpA family protein n=1 Tax=Aliifodinibius sp. S!AR15-10 TaxID=2950437 RepID=UPI0028613628|nr:CvpA family protein [Aliifodinibius sp. S!AR15-10]MDR8391307.1 CvpA family protein [Aliifodinibius sp. S!AR15-10]